MSEVKVNKISPRSGTTVTLGDSGDTFTLASGVSLTGVNATFSGDLTVDTDTLYVDSTNNEVGIGTTSPSTALDVQGGNITQGAIGSNAGRLLIDNTTDTIQRIKVNRGGSTGQLAFHTGADTEAVRIDSSQNLDMTNGGGNIILASGAGIDFSATANSSGTMSSELLDDYEEGTWTPTATAYGGTFITSEAQYVKVGRMVYFHCVVSFSGTDSDRLTIAGLPFTATNTSAVAKYFINSAFSDLMMLVSGTTILGGNTSGDATYTSVSGMTARFSGTYMATA